MYIYSYLFCLDYCKDYCHRVKTQLQKKVITKHCIPRFLAEPWLGNIFLVQKLDPELCDP
jgi:hypothetical protein